MSNRTKIVVLHMKEVIYTLVFAALCVVLIILLVLMFRKDKGTEAKSKYQPGVYASSIQMNDTTIDIEVAVDENRITGVSVKNLSNEVAAMYPLIQPCMDVISQQLYEKQSTANLKSSNEGEYTSKVLIHAIKEALEKAKVD